jgi:hypothetical protein
MRDEAGRAAWDVPATAVPVGAPHLLSSPTPASTARRPSASSDAWEESEEAQAHGLKGLDRQG